MATEGTKSRFELLDPILSEKCKRIHSRAYHLGHRIEKCICEKKVCKVPFQKVLRPIRLASSISQSEKDFILDIRKRFNNKNAAGAFRKREADTEKESQKEITDLTIQVVELKTERDELETEVELFRSLSEPCETAANEYQTDSDQEDYVMTRDSQQLELFNC